MDLDQAIAAHTAWKSKLKAYLQKPDGSLKAREIEVDHKCKLGQWIHGGGKLWRSSAAYADLKREHARFHAAAAALVRKADAGQSVTEEVAVGAASDFSKATTAVVAAIVRLKQEAH